jgi:hypothetical protein
MKDLMCVVGFITIFFYGTVILGPCAMTAWMDYDKKIDECDSIAHKKCNILDDAETYIDCLKRINDKCVDTL